MPEPASPQPLDRTLTIQQVARLLEISERHIRRLVRQGRFFPPIRPGGAPRWTQRDVDTYLWALQRGFTLQGPPQGPGPPAEPPPRRKGET